MRKKKHLFVSFLAIVIAFVCVHQVAAQAVLKEHEDNIYGVKIGMDVPTALKAVFVNANRKPGQEKPDAKRTEGKDSKNIRVLYKLEKGELQIVFAQGKVVREILFKYAKYLRRDDLRLIPNGNIGNVLDGQRYDDRYSSGFTSEKLEEQQWWRDEKQKEGYRIRISFVSRKFQNTGEREITSEDVARKVITIHPEDEAKFNKAMGL